MCCWVLFSCLAGKHPAVCLLLVWPKMLLFLSVPVSIHGPTQRQKYDPAHISIDCKTESFFEKIASNQQKQPPTPLFPTIKYVTQITQTNFYHHSHTKQPSQNRRSKLLSSPKTTLTNSLNPHIILISPNLTTRQNHILVWEMCGFKQNDGVCLLDKTNNTSHN